MPKNNPVETMVCTRLRVAVYVAIVLAVVAIIVSIFSIIFLRRATTELQQARNALERVIPYQNSKD